MDKRISGLLSGPLPAGTTTGDLNVAVTPVPEPESVLLIGAGLAAMAAYKRRRKTS